MNTFPPEEHAIRCTVCQSDGGIGVCQSRYEAVERAVTRGWVLTPVVDLCPSCQIAVKAALEVHRTRYERIGQEALRLVAKSKTELFAILMDEHP